jgi:transposase
VGPGADRGRVPGIRDQPAADCPVPGLARVSGGKSDTGDAHALADMVRTDSHQLRPVAGDSPAAQAVKVVARAHKTLIWERTRHVQRLRHQLRDFFPAALAAFDDLDAPDALELLAGGKNSHTVLHNCTLQ